MITSTKLTVKTFGCFSIKRQIGENTLIISESDNVSRKLWGLIQYLIIFRKRGVSRGELIDAFWGDDFSGSPDNSLKALIFRARRALTALDFPDGKEIIRAECNGYRLNNTICFDIDSEKFEAYTNRAQTEKSPAKKLENAKMALCLYDGDFLSSSSEYSWAATLNVYYHSKYLKLCKTTVCALADKGNFEEIISLCKRALIIEPYDEMLHCALIEAFTETGAMQAAMRHYTYIIDLFISELAISPSKELTSLYRKISVSSAYQAQNLPSIRQSLSESFDEMKPFQCGYSAFLEIYRLEARTLSRAGRTSQLVLLKLAGKNGGMLSKGQISSGTKYLEEAITASLRCSDVFCFFGSAQYLLLLPDTSCENAIKAINRVLRCFDAEHPRVSYGISHTLLPVLPVRTCENTISERAENRLKII